MIKKKHLIGSICCGIASVVCSIGALPFFENSHTANAYTITLTDDNGIKEYSSLTDDMYFNPYGMFDLFVYSPLDEYEEGYGTLYSYDLPLTWGTIYDQQNVFISYAGDSGYILDSTYEVNRNTFTLETAGPEFGSAGYIYSLEAYSCAIWVDPLYEVALVCDVPLILDQITARVYNPTSNSYEYVHPEVDIDWTWHQSNHWYSCRFGDIIGDFISALDFDPYIQNSNCISIQDMQIRFLADEDSGFFRINGYTQETTPILNYYVRQSFVNQNPTRYEVPPDNLFTWIFEAVSSFLSVEILPNFSFGDLVLLALGVMIFGVGLKIAFGG